MTGFADAHDDDSAASRKHQLTGTIKCRFIKRGERCLDRLRFDGERAFGNGSMIGCAQIFLISLYRHSEPKRSVGEESPDDCIDADYKTSGDSSLRQIRLREFELRSE